MMGDARAAAEVQAAPAHTWTVSLARRSPVRSAVVFGSVIVGCVAVGFLYGGVGYGVLSAVALLGSTATYWIPRRYSLSSEHLDVSFCGRLRPMRYAWTQFKMCVGSGDAVFLSRLAAPSPLARYRGLTVFVPRGDRAIVAYIEERVRIANSARPVE